MLFSIVDRWHTMWNVIFHDVSVKLERKWNRQFTRPIFLVGAKNGVWERDYILQREAYIANTRNDISGTSGDSDKRNSFIQVHMQGNE